MWDLPGPGLEPVSPALAGGFLTAAPPGKPFSEFFNDCVLEKEATLSIHWKVICVHGNMNYVKEIDRSLSGTNS